MTIKSILPFLALLAPLAAPVAAKAQPRPMIIPQHDAAVTYHLEGGRNVPSEAKAFFQAGGGKVRIESSNQPGYILIDRVRGKAQMVIPNSNFALETDIGREIDRALNDPSAEFHRIGPSNVAGMPCMLWTMQARDASGKGCVTQDGLILSADGHNRHGEHVTLHAQTVAEEPLPNGMFQGPKQSLRLDGLAKFGRALQGE